MIKGVSYSMMVIAHTTQELSMRGASVEVDFRECTLDIAEFWP
jgi:hypothetical protein